MTHALPGALVRYREREWVVLPSDDPALILLRPIGGSVREVCGVARTLADEIAFTIPYERIQPAQFPLPEPDDVQDLAAVRLVMESARLLLRDGAAPFRALGRLSVRPRPYQFVPLVMALRQQTVRLLIADDVGVGKTIEAALIARELLDRGAARRLAVLCPPYLCEQWQRELAEKFHIDAVIIRAARWRAWSARRRPTAASLPTSGTSSPASIRSRATRTGTHFYSTARTSCLWMRCTAPPSLPRVAARDNSSAMPCCARWRRTLIATW
jgi:hypothetical protein